MDIRECYISLGGNYDNVLARLVSEERVKRFLLKFPDDKTYFELATATDHLDYEGSFRAAHTLKGICANLGLDRLCSSASALCEYLRPERSGERSEGEINSLYATIAEDYKLTVAAIRAYGES